MKFSLVADFFSKIENTSGRLEMTRLLSDLFNSCSAKEAQIVAYFSLGEMNPPYIGTQFQIADKMLIRAISRVLNESESEVKESLNKLGDLGSVIDIREKFQDSHYSVQEVYEQLSEIEKTSGTGSQEKKLELIEKLLLHSDNLSAKYIIRILAGKLRLGFSDMTIVDALSNMLAGDKSLKKIIENAYNICADIGQIAYTAKSSGVPGLEDMKIHVGVPIRPAAAERLPTAKDIFEKLGSGIVAQPKLDGFRLQIHIDKSHKQPVIRFFSRNLIDMSHMFPELIKPFEDLDVESLICEGEAIVFDPNTGNFVPFQETVKRRRKHDIKEMAQDLPLKVFIFDVLYLNGKSLMEDTHHQRRAILEHLFHKKNSIVLAIEEKKIHSVKELEDYFYENIDAGLEGLVVKRPESHYQPGKRNFNWIKLKRQEHGELEDTIDCVVLGYYFGQGKRAQFGIGGFLVGIYNKSCDIFEAITKIGTGLSDQDFIDLKKCLDKIGVQHKPKNVECVKELHPDVWVNPELVVMVRADEITQSPRYTAGASEGELGYALRFPRFMGYREDKSAYDATTSLEIRHMFKDQKSR